MWLREVLYTRWFTTWPLWRLNCINSFQTKQKNKENKSLWVKLYDHRFPLKVWCCNELTDCEMLHLLSTVDSAQGMRLIKLYVVLSHNVSGITSRVLCSFSSSISCSKTHRLLLSACGRCHPPTPPFHIPVIKNTLLGHLTLSCCYSGTYHLCSPLGYWYKSKCPPPF